jgi:YidC/Oxa1 family membrane protein insertase
MKSFILISPFFFGFFLFPKISLAMDDHCNVLKSIVVLNQISEQHIECSNHSAKIKINSNLKPFRLNLPKAITQLNDTFNFHGLAIYLNKYNVHGFELDTGVVLSADEFLLDDQIQVVLAGRFRLLIIKFPGARYYFLDKKSIFELPENSESVLEIVVVNKSESKESYAVFDVFRYSNLFWGLRHLARFFEWTLEKTNSLVNSWGWSIVVFALMIKFLLIPFSLGTSRIQRNINQIQSELKPKIAAIKANYGGEDAHKKIIAEYKRQGVSPFFPLKSMLGLVVPIPILIAIFNALGVMSQFEGAPFLWIDDLAYPDSVGFLPFEIPFLGDHVSLLPFLMMFVSMLGVKFYKNQYAGPVEIRIQKRRLMAMAVIFFFLFYPFPASMVLYWTMANGLHILQQRVLRLN